ncbi:MAG: hypothetical protein ACTHM5_12165 [Ginsengibacter sp.]
MKYLHLTDEQIQQYLLEKATCTDEIVEHIQACTHCKERAEEYNMLFRGIQQQEKPVFDFELADLVLQQLPKSQTQPFSEKWLSLLTIFISTLFFCVIVYLFGKNLVVLFGGISTVFIGLIITTVISIFVFLYIDMNKSYHAKMKALNF